MSTGIFLWNVIFHSILSNSFLSFGNIFRDGEVTIDGLEKDSATKNNQGHNDDSVDDVADDEVDDENEFVSLDPEEIVSIHVNILSCTYIYYGTVIY